MKINPELQHCINELIHQGKLTAPLQKIYSISGGSVNHAFGIETTQESFFIKLNQRERFPGMFQKEVEGLQLLDACGPLRVPEVIYEGSSERTAFLVLELVREEKEQRNYWEKLGEGIAAIHQNTGSDFGLAYDNYNGSLTQFNTWKSSWSEFFIENRLNAQLKLAVDNHRVDTDFVQLFKKAIVNFKDVFPQEEPALLHGDLWSGNFITDERGKPVLIDPAVYYGHREVDLAMSLLFGGFHQRFYKAYNKAFPLEADWEKRVDLFNLYPLMVHVNLFSASYAQRVRNILKKWT